MIEHMGKYGRRVFGCFFCMHVEPTVLNVACSLDKIVIIIKIGTDKRRQW